jgi:hypothetical protein
LVEARLARPRRPNAQRETAALLGFRGLCDETFCTCDLGYQLGGKGVSGLNVLGGVRRHPDRALLVLPREGFEWKVEPHPRRGYEQRGAGLRVAEQKHLHRAHGEPGALRIAAEVDARENGEPRTLRQRLEPIECLEDGMGASYVECA